ncbi:MAG TPA: aminotransferase class I/II-fold pyridoxal phosphate-dependent enzyme [Acidimicrobiales bacterium]|nr:aminotransferase class I/II-fold pyridoxal phosphate-dependent enzyme [Acidimicrobiales bacterium]
MVLIPPAGAHGGDGERVARALGLPPDGVLDLSQSLNPVAPDVAPVVARHAGAARHYPDATGATHALARAMSADPDRLVLTNGGAEAIALTAAELGAGWVDEPEFSLYRRHLPAVRPGAPRWRSDPHNPTGLLAPPGAVAGVWDEAFYPLATGRWTSGRAETGAVVLGSLTKVLACPGLRIGYVLAPDAAFAQRVRARQPRWAVNGMALAALPELLEGADLAAWQQEVARLRRALVGVLARHALCAEPSDANYLLVRGAAGLRERLAPLGVVVRDCASFGLEGTVRIAVPDRAGLDRLDAALARLASP